MRAKKCHKCKYFGGNTNDNRIVCQVAVGPVDQHQFQPGEKFESCPQRLASAHLKLLEVRRLAIAHGTCNEAELDALLQLHKVAS